MKKFSLIILSLFLILSCANDDDITNIPPPVDPTALTGVFIDAEVEGLTYTTETQSGTTNAMGEFKYLEGETVTFSVGNIIIGSSTGTSEMTPISIASTSNATIETDEVKNIAAFLQSLDSDHNPENGISINEDVVNAISLNEIDFTKSIIQILGEIVGEINMETNANLKVIYPEAAALHLATSLEKTYETTDVVFNNFIPSMESWLNFAYNSIYWIHQVDDQGKLTTSIMYERYPNRIYRKFTYSMHSENGLPTKIDQENYRYGELSQKISSEVTYSESNQIQSFINISEDESFYQKINIIDFDEKNRIIKTISYNRDDEFINRQQYLFDEAGNVYQRNLYNTESANDDSNIFQKFEYTFNSRGDFNTDRYSSGQDVRLTEYFYRNDYTLERAEAEQNFSNNRKSISSFDENEIPITLFITEGDYRTEYYYENGIVYKTDTYFNEFLYEIITYNSDGSSEWKTINENDLTYKIEYKDAEGTITNTEYYTAEGSIISESTLAGTTWDILYLHTDTITWRADVTFYEDGTAFYTEPASPGVYDMWGTWSLNGNIITYDMDGENDDPLYYVLTGTISGNNMNGTYTFGDRNPEWVAVKYE